MKTLTEILNEILDFSPQLASPESGAEPSLRQLIDNYYVPHFPDNYQDFTKDYVEAIEKHLQEVESKSELKEGDLVSLCVDTENLPKNSDLKWVGLKKGDVGIVTSLTDSSNYSYEVNFQYGSFTFNREELIRL